MIQDDGIGESEGDGIALGGVSASAVADVARGEQAAAGDGLRDFADDHAVHDDEVAGLEIDERHLVLGRDGLGDGTLEIVPTLDDGSRCERNEGDEDVVAGIDLKTVSGIGVFLGGRDSAQSVSWEGYRLGRARWLAARAMIEGS